MTELNTQAAILAERQRCLDIIWKICPDEEPHYHPDTIYSLCIKIVSAINSEVDIDQLAPFDPDTDIV